MVKRKGHLPIHAESHAFRALGDLHHEGNEPSVPDADATDTHPLPLTAAFGSA
jgi:hypothetical protein